MQHTSFVRTVAWIVALAGAGERAAAAGGPVVIADFETPEAAAAYTKDQRITHCTEPAGVTRGKGSLRIDPTGTSPVNVVCETHADQIGKDDWLCFDVIGADKGRVDLTFHASWGQGETAGYRRRYMPVTVGASTYRVLGSDLLGRGAKGVVSVRLSFTAVPGPARPIHLDAVRIEPEPVPSLEAASGGAYDFGLSALWPGFRQVDTELVHAGGPRWQWTGSPQLVAHYSLGGDPLTYDGVGVAVGRHTEQEFVLAVEPGRYAGWVFHTPFYIRATARHEFAVGIGRNVIDRRRVPLRRLFTTEGIFAGYDATDWSPEAYWERTIEPNFRCVRFNATVKGDGLKVRCLNTTLRGLIVYPAREARTWEPYVKGLQQRRRDYFAQTIYRYQPAPDWAPVAGEAPYQQAAGVQVLAAPIGVAAHPEFRPEERWLVKDTVELVGLPGEPLVQPIGLLAGEPVKGLRVTAAALSRGAGARGIPVTVERLRTMPIVYSSLVRRPAPVWPAPLGRVLDLDGGQLQWLLLRLDVPAGAAAGRYTGHLRLDSRGREAVEVPVSLEVGPVEYRSSPICRGAFYQSPDTAGYLLTLVEADAETIDKVAVEDLELLRRHGINALDVPAAYLVGYVPDQQLRQSYLRRQARWCRQTGLCREARGLLSFAQMVSVLTAGGRRVDRNTPKLMAEGIAASLKTVAEERLAVDPLIVYDSGSSSSAARWTPAAADRVASMVRQAGGRRLAGAFYDPRPGSKDEGVLDKFGRLLIGPRYAAEVRRRIEPAKGRVEVMTHTPTRFLAGVGLWAAQLDGYWITQTHRHYAPGNVLDNPGGVLLMPTPKGSRETVYLLAARQGEQDYAYLKILEGLMATSQDAVAKAAARAALDFAMTEVAGQQSNWRSIYPATDPADGGKLEEARRRVFEQICAMGGGRE